MKHLVTCSYQREVDKGKLIAVESFEKMTFRVCALRRYKESFSKLTIAVNLPLSTSHSFDN